MRADDNGTVGFTPDGSEVIIAENNGSVREWSLDPEDWVEAACRIVGRDITRDEWETYLEGRDKRSVCAD